MSSVRQTRERRGERFWRAHHEAWKQSSLNQREYCELHDLSRKAFENWRAMFRKEPEPLKPKLLASASRRRGQLLWKRRSPSPGVLNSSRRVEQTSRLGIRVVSFA